MSLNHKEILDKALDRAIDHAAATGTPRYTKPSEYARRLLGNDATLRLLREMDGNRDEYRRWGGERVKENEIDMS